MHRGAAHNTRLALVTGASSGIGEEFARQLAAKGYDLVLVARGEEKLQELAAGLQSAHGIAVEVLSADLTDAPAQLTVEGRLRSEPAIDLLVNSAGHGGFGNFAESDIDIEAGEVELNVIALMRLTRAALPGMIARKRGGIINVSSMAGFFPGPNSATYNATKTFVNSFTESLYEELRGTGVRVQALCPGFTRSGFQERARLEPSRIPEIAWLDPPEVVRESLIALNHDVLFCIPGARYKALGFAGSLLPRPILRRIAARNVQH
ncbi:hypothetical protein AYO38_01025 [bacterium SCGC AG-212-C10]|nr:hypothetical protein AYO38_01025 [bacterium SCGC AG-212-C10]